MRDLAKNIRLPSIDDLFSTEEERQDAKLEKIQILPLSELHPFEGHPFQVRDDEEMDKMVDSVKEYGVMTPASHVQGFFITAKEMKPIGELPKYFAAGASGDCRCSRQCRQLAGVFALSRVYNALRFPESGAYLQPAPRSHHAGRHRHLEPCCRALG